MNRWQAVAAWVVVALAGQTVLAQQRQIQWRTDPRQAVSEAQRAKLPLMVYVLGSTSDRDDRLERGQRRALADPRVLQAAQRFIPLRLSRSANRDVLGDFHLPESANMMMSFVAPDGSKLGDLGANGVAEAEALYRKLELTFEEYRNRMYRAELQPVLQNEAATPAELRAAIATILQFEITFADRDLLAMLEREGLDAAVRSEVLSALGALSTRPAMVKLIELAKAGEAGALTALERSNPLAAEMMLPDLQNPATFQYGMYRAVTRIVKLPQPKPERFFENANERVRAQELDRLNQAVERAVQRWRSEHDNRS